MLVLPWVECWCWCNGNTVGIGFGGDGGGVGMYANCGTSGAGGERGGE